MRNVFTVVLEGLLATGLIAATLSGAVALSPEPSPTSSVAQVPSPRDPFAAKAVANYLSGRRNFVTAALYDESSGETFLYNPKGSGATASIIKVNILAGLLYVRSKSKVALTPEEDGLAKLAIEQSDNNAAESLWENLGYNRGLNVLNSKLKLSGTKLDASNAWGNTVTSPRDQLKLLKQIVLPSKLISPPNQTYIKTLMEHVIASQRFGVPSGVPAKVEVGVKNGWDTEANTGWQINTIGYVQSKHNPYLLVVMTHNNPNEVYGINTVSGVGKLVWGFESKLPSYPAQ